MPTPLHRSERRSVLLVFFLTFVIYAYFMPRWADWNIDSRLDLVHALVDDRSLRIDRYHYNTWDKALTTDKVTGATHYYSDKAPGTAVLGVAVYAAYEIARDVPVVGGGIHSLLMNSAWLVPLRLGRTSTQLSPAAKGTNLGGCQRAGTGNVQYIPWGNRLFPPMRDWALSKYVVTVGVVGFVSALFAAFFFWFLGLWARHQLSRWLLTGLYALCTVVLPYSTNFYSHQVAAACLFAAFALLYMRKYGGGPAWIPPVVGFLLGFALLTEYTVLVIVAFLSLYAVYILRRRKRTIAYLATGGVVPIGFLLGYNKASFGGWFDTGYSHDFCWSSAQAAGIAGFTSPHLNVIFDLTLGSYRGLFYMSPFLLFAVPGAFLARRRRVALECWMCVAMGVAFIVILSAYWGWNGGKVEGPRYLVPVVPFLAFPCIFLLDSLRRIPGAWFLVAPVALWSAFATWTMFLGGELFPVSWYRDPIFEYSMSRLGANEIAPNAGAFLGLSGWHSLVPLVGLIAIGCLIFGGWAADRVTDRVHVIGGESPPAL